MLTATSKSNNLADFLTTKESKTERPYPKANIGVITGEINIAPMTTALEFIFNPIEAIKIAHTNIIESLILISKSCNIFSLNSIGVNS